MGKKKNPHNFKLVWDSRKRVEKVPDSPLLCIGLAVNSGQYYGALVNPLDFTNYTLYANITSYGSTSFAVTFKEIENEEEHRAIDDYFLKAGVFEYYYKGDNWDFPVARKKLGNPGDKVNDDKNSVTYGKKNIYEPHGDIQVPPWFKDRYMRE